MKINTTTTLAIAICCSILLFSCDSSSDSQSNKNKPLPAIGVPATDSLVYSFAFMGCNRVDRGDRHNKKATNKSTANLYALKRIYNDLCNHPNKPDAFFFLGDLVLGESTLQHLDKQLDAWLKLYKDQSFSNISNSGIELIAAPGNHEMLTYADHHVPGHDEWPLKGAEDIWLKYMNPFMPKDRDNVTGSDSMNNRSTFSFVRKNIGFIVMNTDTYNPPTKKNPWGLEGMIPTKWIVQKIKDYRNSPNIDHIFVLGHKPYYVYNKPETGHQGLPEGPVLWPEMMQNKVAAMLSAHVHDYQRMQPDTSGKGTYQIIAGNGGSQGQATFFGYTIINIYASGKVELLSRGYKKGTPYYEGSTPEAPFKIEDSTILTWEANANPYTL